MELEQHPPMVVEAVLAIPVTTLVVEVGALPSGAVPLMLPQQVVGAVDAKVARMVMEVAVVVLLDEVRQTHQTEEVVVQAAPNRQREWVARWKVTSIKGTIALSHLVAVEVADTMEAVPRMAATSVEVADLLTSQS